MKKAVLLMSMGGPDQLKDVRPFLYNLFSDPFILRIPAPLRKILAFLISTARFREACEIYKKIGGSSPLKRETEKQAQALEKRLSVYGNYRCFIGMSYWKPFIKETIDVLLKEEVDEIILLPLYPQYSTTTSESCFHAARTALKGRAVPLRKIESFYAQEGFLQAVLKQARPLYEEAKRYGTPRLLFSAHGLPEKIVQSGDPYVKQVEQTVALLWERWGEEKPEKRLCYQSKVGPIPWTKPALMDEIDRAAAEKRPILVIPIAFVCEHSETLVELDLLCKERALKGGAPFFARSPTVGTDDAFIDGLALKIEEN